MYLPQSIHKTLDDSWTLLWDKVLGVLCSEVTEESYLETPRTERKVF
jgi:hypothetical protein